MASSCALGGVSVEILSKACSSWLAKGCVSGALGVELAVEALLAWEQEVKDAGLPQLRQAHAYLERQLELVQDSEGKLSRFRSSAWPCAPLKLALEDLERDACAPC